MQQEIRHGLILVIGLGLIFLVFNFLITPDADPQPQAEKVPNDSAQTILHIPKLAVTAPVIYISSTEENDIQIGLQSGVVHYEGTADFGEIGNAYIIGHSSDYENAPGEFQTIFAKLPQMELGDEIIILAEDQLVYKVIDKKIVEPDDLTVLSQETQGRKLLTLQTSYPVGTAKQRLIVIGELSE